MVELQSIWTWQPALYLFLGGMGAGAFVVAGVIFYRFKEGNERAINITAWASVACLAVGLLLLLTELTFPLRGMLLWQSFSHFTSWMTVGAWLLFVAVVVMGIVAVLTTPSLVNRLVHDESKRRTYLLLENSIFKGLMSVGMLLGLGVAVYTGVLLMSAPGVPFWNTAFLPCLFTISALDTGVALVEVVLFVRERGKRFVSATAAKNSDGKDASRVAISQGMPDIAVEQLAQKTKVSLHRFIGITVIALVILELVVLAIYLGISSSLAGSSIYGDTAALSSQILFKGSLAPLFWILVVLVGLVFPLIVAAMGLSKKGMPKGVAFVGPICVMVGGCSLRFLVLAVGLHADVVGEALIKVFS